MQKRQEEVLNTWPKIHKIMYDVCFPNTTNCQVLKFGFQLQFQKFYENLPKTALFDPPLAFF